MPEPFRPARSAARVAVALDDLVRRNVDSLDDFADGALLDEFAGVDCGLYLEPLAVHDGVSALRFCDRLSHLGELFERRDAWLVRKKVFAPLHGSDAQGSTLVGDLGAEHKLDRRVVE